MVTKMEWLMRRPLGLSEIGGRDRGPAQAHFCGQTAHPRGDPLRGKPVTSRLF